MSAIFLSHSSKDNAVAAEFKEHLERQGHRSIFLDFDPEDGIPAGRDWEQELYQRLRECRAMIVLCSESSMSSRWCFAEITHAKSLGKHVFPIKIAPCEIDTVLTSSQVLDFSAEKEEALERLWLGLRLAGLDPADAFDWDGSRPPYPGLLAFQEQDAAIFFGRSAEIQQGLELLNRLRHFGGARIVGVLGPSGSGKSSLVRAGLIPRLRRDEQSWLIIDPFRPQARPLRELSVVLAKAFRVNGEERSWKELLNKLQDDPCPESTGNTLVDLAEELLIVADRPDARVLVVVDQVEELLGPSQGSDLETDEAAASNFATSLWSLMGSAVRARRSPLMVLFTLRSDFLGRFQAHPLAGHLEFEDVRLRPLPVEGLLQAIEAPAKLSGVRLEPGLSQAMIEDARTDHALPLLAFALRELYERYRHGGVLRLKAYRHELGGLSGSVASTADSVFLAHPLSVDQKNKLRRAFVSMVRVNEDGQYVRRAADWGTLPVSVQYELERFVKARLLVARGDKGNRILEVSHEALFNSWDRFRGWLDEDRERLTWHQRIRSAASTWDTDGRTNDGLWRGTQLRRAREHYDELQRLERDFVDAGVRLHKRRRRVASVAALLALGSVVIAIVSVLPFGLRVEVRSEVIHKSRWILSDDRRFAIAFTQGQDSISWWVNSEWSNHKKIPRVFESIVVSPMAKYVAGTTRDGAVYVWEAKEGLARSTKPVASVSVLSQGRGGGLISPGRRFDPIDLPNICFGPNEERLAVSATDGALYLYDLRSRSRTTLPEVDTKARNMGAGTEPATVAFSPGGQWLAVLEPSGKLHVCKARSDSPVLELLGETRAVEHAPRSFRFSSNEQWIAATRYEDGALCIWPLGDESLQPRPLLKPKDRFGQFIFNISPNDRWVVARRTSDTKIVEIDLQEQNGATRVVSDIGDPEQGWRSYENSFSFSSDSRWAAGNGFSGDLCIWRLGAMDNSHNTVTIRMTGESSLRSAYPRAVFGPANHIAAVNSDRQVFVWRLGDEPDFSKVKCQHSGTNRSLNFSSDGRWLLSMGDPDLFWGELSDERLARVRVRESVPEFSMSADSKTLVALGIGSVTFVQRRFYVLGVPVNRQAWPSFGR